MGTTLLEENFSSGAADGFLYVDNASEPGQPLYANVQVQWRSLASQPGWRRTIPSSVVTDMSGGWAQAFQVSGAGLITVTFSLHYNLSQTRQL